MEYDALVAAILSASDTLRLAHALVVFRSARVAELSALADTSTDMCAALDCEAACLSERIAAVKAVGDAVKAARVLNETRDAGPRVVETWE